MAKVTTKLTSLLLLGSAFLLAAYARGQEMRVPEHAIANARARIATSGSGAATFYLFGPSGALKKDVKLGEEIALAPDDVRSAGRYTAVLRAGTGGTTHDFFVTPAPPATLNFLAR